MVHLNYHTKPDFLTNGSNQSKAVFLIYHYSLLQLCPNTKEL